MKKIKLPKFPHPDNANEYGLLAIGGDLSMERLLAAYSQGIFPWYSPGEPILWHSPDPRMLLFPENLNVSKSMRRVFNQNKFTFTSDKAFEAVIKACSEIPRSGQEGTWITQEMMEAYISLHKAGFAHSVEVWSAENKLVGGIYGVSIGKAFFGESMFSKVSNASKAALIKLTQALQVQGFDFVDCQVYTEHLESMGAQLYPRTFFLEKLSDSIKKPGLNVEKWADLFAENQ
ncbi:MAG: leucyl/phenylalanyl-tRNA--protein transferase [Chitinophagales bacterium]